MLDGDVGLVVDLTSPSRATLRLRHGDVHAELTAAALSVPYPSGLERLRAAAPDVDLVIAERLPPGLQRAAAEQKISYLDLRGRGRVIAPGLVYLAPPCRGVAEATRSRTSPFAPQASRVVRVLLSDAGRSWRLSDIAASARLNPGTVHRALTALVERGMVERDRDAYLLADPGSLLEAWGDQAQPPRERFAVRLDGGLHDTVGGLVADLDAEAVVSGELAAEALAPYLPAESAIVHCLDPERFAALQHREAHRPRGPSAPRPGEVLVDLADAASGDFGATHGGLYLASAAQVYVDLLSDRGRGRQAAEHLRRTVIGF